MFTDRTTNRGELTMCYNNCKHFRFNPMTGDDKCVRGKARCPEIELEEGDDCPEECPGTMGYELVEECSCHIKPPCSACENNPLVCSHCGYTEE